MALWQEYRARQYMKNLGIGAELVMSKSITLADVDQIVSPANDLVNNTCYRTFKQGVMSGIPASTAIAGKRVRQTRQHLGVYRHDLLVAMRVINAIEQEMVHAEWEHWVANEAEKCIEVVKLLKPNNSTVSSDGIGKDVRSRLVQYCSTCEAASANIRY